MLKADIDRDPIEALAAEFLERQRCGERVTIDGYADEHPELSEDIRELFPTIIAMENLKSRKERSDSGRASLGGVSLERLGDFRIIREVGRGGMGIVYEAEQESLNRRVAVKVLPRQTLLDEKHLRRFQREAQTAANLHHTNIVPVFGVGQQDGFHYYVMQFIDGVGLDEALGEDAPTRYCALSSPASIIDVAAVRASERTSKPSLSEHPLTSQEIANIGLQVADALSYAHGQGVLHRDIKPGNLLLDDEQNVWVADFGLAKAMEHDDVSRTGDVVGTLRYMAPERFSGEMDARGDIYALGLTLYELLTRRAAYANTERSRLIHQITQESPPPPRKLNADVPRDLETIVLKAIAREPERRYQSAGDLALDLKCFLEDRPIRARRVSPPERLWRWCRRNPAVASLTVTALSLLVLVAVVSSAAYVSTKQALKGESEQREKAEEVSKVALEAFEKFYQESAANRIIPLETQSIAGTDGEEIVVPTSVSVSKERAALLESMLPLLDKLAARSEDSVHLRQGSAKAYRRVGDIHQRLAQYAKALAAYDHSLSMYQKLQDEADESEIEFDVPARRDSPEQPEFAVEIARIHNERGNVYFAQKKSTEARTSYNQALATLEPLVAKAKRPTSYFELARTHYLIARRVPHVPVGGPGPGRDGPGRDGPGRDGPGRDGPGRDGPGRGGPGGGRRGPPFRNESFGGPPFPGAAFRGGPDGDDQSQFERREHFKKAIDIIEDMPEEFSGEPSLRHLLACCYRDAPRDYFRAAGYEMNYGNRQSIKILEQLVKEFPGLPDYQYDLMEAYAEVDIHRGRFEDDRRENQEEQLRKALDLSHKLAVEHPGVPDYKISQVHIYHKLATLLRRSRLADEAEWYFHLALDRQEELVEQFPESATHSTWLAVIKLSISRYLQREDRTDEALLLLSEAASGLESLKPSEVSQILLHSNLASIYKLTAEVLIQTGRYEEAAEAFSTAEKHRSKRS